MSQIVKAEAQQIVSQSDTMDVNELVRRTALVQQVMQKVMKKDEHYGVIPGTNRPTLLKPGAEKIQTIFRLAPSYTWEEQRDGEHVTFIVTCKLTHIPSATSWGEGIGICSTKESKYRYRKSKMECPNCGKEVRRSKNEPEFYCWAKMGGCGATFPLNDPRIKAPEQVENPDITDTYNTVMKMACKRAQLAAVLTSTGASDFFTQDMDDLRANYDMSQHRQQQQAQQQAPPPPPAPPVQQPRPPMVDRFDDEHGSTHYVDTQTGEVVHSGPADPPPRDDAPPPTQDDFIPAENQYQGNRRQQAETQRQTVAQSKRGTDTSTWPGQVPFPFGKHQGAPLGEIPTNYLEWASPRVEASVNDPEKGKYKEKNQDLLNAIRAELKLRDDQENQNETQAQDAADAQAQAMGVTQEGDVPW